MQPSAARVQQRRRRPSVVMSYTDYVTLRWQRDPIGRVERLPADWRRPFAHASMSARSHSMQRPAPISTTGAGKSGWRARYTETLDRRLRLRGAPYRLAFAKSRGQLTTTMPAGRPTQRRSVPFAQQLITGLENAECLIARQRRQFHAAA